MNQDYSLDACEPEGDTLCIGSKPEREMTVCIAAIAGPVKAKHIVSIVDMRGSAPQGTNEQASVKSEWVTHRWQALFAGNDVSPCVPICEAVAKSIGGQPNTCALVMETFEKEYQHYLSRLAAARVLGRWKMTIEQFEETGRKKFGPDNFDMLFSAIQEVRLNCQFLVSGFDEDDQPHLFLVKNPGIAENYDTPGYFAIGDGAAAAFSILGFFRQNIVNSLENTFYNVCVAKYMAESSCATVGRSTFLWNRTAADNPSQPHVLYEILAATRKAWEECGGRPSIPAGTEEQLTKIIESPQSNIEKSASAR